MARILSTKKGRKRPHIHNRSYKSGKKALVNKHIPKRLKRITKHQFLYSDFDKDGVPNYKDCRPFDKNRQDDDGTPGILPSQKTGGSSVSPNEMFAEAKKQMLGGREPETKRDWEKIMNFFAANIASGLEESASLLVNRIYGSHLTDEEVKNIARFQATRKSKFHRAIVKRYSDKKWQERKR